MKVTFESLGRNRRRWVERFDLGSDFENGMKALDVAWKRSARIVNVAR